MLNIMVVEDSFREMEYCCSLIERCLPECNILKAGDQKSALNLLKTMDIDLFFLDVDLPDGNGFQIAERIRKREQFLMTPIVFVTAFKANHLEIHRRYHHYEFVEKPYSWQSFSALLQPVLEKLEKEKKKGVHVAKPEVILLVETADVITYVKRSSVLYVQSQMRKLSLVTTEGTIPDLRITLHAFLKSKDWSFLKQCHKSFAINMDNVKSISPVAEKSWVAYFDQAMQVSCPVGVTYYNEITELFKRRKLEDEA